MGHFLEEWQLMENTVIIFTSDNGMTTGGCGFKKKDKNLRAPFFKTIGKDKDGKPMSAYNANMKGLKGLKGSVDEGGVRVPFFVRWGSKLTPVTIDKVGNYMDLLPTLVELAGAELPKDRGFKK